MNSDEINSVAISFFSCFLFHQEVFSSKNYRAFGFKLPDKKLISLRRITIFHVECRSPIKICSFSFFRIWSAIAQQITSNLRQFANLSASSSDLNSMCSSICISPLYEGRAPNFLRCRLKLWQWMYLHMHV